ncbi:Tripartite-type tricarboxylate transporter, receptor component TctC [Natronincola peptidivorans]|uniref:Tripartite-type tricarboxylate transporter, receptor component TctC n=1 Tax=Natronincola peptidivorans TaxID=426128 RepID=A0A1I0CC02_9FIRM|nr:tripartite tricarboxylate transporter substrate binding protein [Natronincola peptidivorans]SET16783.1 Tripartite-type tricarboxylate transporter, receptor component TctC [Natronincola peptidivorans]
MKKSLKFITVLLVLMLAISAFAVGCSSTSDAPAGQNEGGEGNTAGNDFPTKPIDVIVSFGAGGGTDVGARILLPYVEKELGVPINVINKPGAGGWVGWADLVNENPDGYTLGYINTPAIITGYLNPNNNRRNTIDDFDLISNHVTDYNVIAVKADDNRFENIDDVIKLAQETELTATSTGIGTDNHIAILTLNNELGTNFTTVQMGGGNEIYAAVLGGHVDVLISNVGEATAGHNSGDIRILAVLAPERVDFIPDVPTLEEAGYGEIYGYSARGIAAPKDMDPAILEKITDAFAKAMEDEDHIRRMAEMGLQVNAVYGDEYYNQVKQVEENIKHISDLLGW